MSTPLHLIAIRQAVQALAENGFDGMAQAMELLLNECMKIERQQALGVGPYQRGEARHGQANGFKPKRLKTRVGPLNARYCKKLWMGSFSAGLGLDTVDESYSLNDVGQQLGIVQEPPFLRGGLHQFEDHGQAGATAATSLGPPMS